MDAASTVFGTDSTSVDGALGIILLAQVLDDGGVIVADEVGPHIKMFRADGALHNSFLQTGGGPSETSGVAAVATTRDQIAIAHRERFLTIHAHDGTLVSERIGLPVTPLAMKWACGGWGIYGPGSAPGSATTSWFHLAGHKADGSRAWESSYENLPPRQVAYGRPYNIVANDDAVIFLHEVGDGRAELVRRSCTGEIQVVTQAGNEMEEPFKRREEVRYQVNADRPLPAGLGLVESCVVRASLKVMEAGVQTVFSADCVGSASSTVTVDGIFIIRDSHPHHGILLETDEPYPHLLLIPVAAMSALLRL